MVTVLAFHDMAMERRDLLRILCTLPNLACVNPNLHIFDASQASHNVTKVKSSQEPKCRLKCLAIQISPEHLGFALQEHNWLCRVLISIPCCISALESLFITVIGALEPIYSDEEVHKLIETSSCFSHG